MVSLLKNTKMMADAVVATVDSKHTYRSLRKDMSARSFSPLAKSTPAKRAAKVARREFRDRPRPNCRVPPVSILRPGIPQTPLWRPKAIGPTAGG